MAAIRAAGVAIAAGRICRQCGRQYSAAAAAPSSPAQLSNVLAERIRQALPAEATDTLRRNGYVVVKDVFGPELTDRFRSEIKGTYVLSVRGHPGPFAAMARNRGWRLPAVLRHSIPVSSKRNDP